MTDAVDQIVAAIGRWQEEAPGVLVVAIDGHGAAGKTTIAAAVLSAVSVASAGGAGGAGGAASAASALSAVSATVLHTDDYFYEAREGGERRPMAQYYAWDALREEALGPALARARDEAPHGRGARLILVEGVSSASPALADLVDRAVFVSTPEPLRLERLHRRISDEQWDEEWLYAERLYFASRPPDSFDLVVSGVD